MPARREILKGGLALTASTAVLLPAGAAQAGAADGPLRFVVDMRLPEAALLAERARQGCHGLHDPAGEIVHLLHAPEWRSRGGVVIGLTTWSDFALARDILRTSGNPIRHAVALNGPLPRLVAGKAASAEQRMLAELLGPAPRRRDQRATSFLWLA